MISEKQKNRVWHLNYKNISTCFFLATLFCTQNYFVNGAVSLTEFLPYQAGHGATVKNLDTDIIYSVNLGFRFRYFGKEYTTVYIPANGMLKFAPDGLFWPMVGGCLAKNYFNSPSLMALLAILAQENGGTISYAAGQDRTQLDKLSNDIFQANLKMYRPLTDYFVATWNNVPHYYDHGYKSTFQIILTTDGLNSFVLFYYNKIQIPPDYRYKVFAGLVGNTGNLTIILGSVCDGNIKNLVSGSNFNVSGKWAFQVHEHVPGEKDLSNDSTSSIVRFMMFYVKKVSSICLPCD